MTRILIVDDQVGIRRALRTVLERAGFEVCEARDGQDALRLWREQPSSLVITDIHMPDKGGIETILELRALSPNLPAIVISGSGGKKARDLLRDAKLLESVRTMDKPFTLTEVLKCVSEALNGNGRK